MGSALWASLWLFKIDPVKFVGSSAKNADMKNRSWRFFRTVRRTTPFKTTDNKKAPSIYDKAVHKGVEDYVSERKKPRIFSKIRGLVVKSDIFRTCLDSIPLIFMRILPKHQHLYLSPWFLGGAFLFILPVGFEPPTARLVDLKSKYRSFNYQ